MAGQPFSDRWERRLSAIAIAEADLMYLSIRLIVTPKNRDCEGGLVALDLLRHCIHQYLQDHG